MPWGEDKPVKTIRTAETDAHWVAGAQYYRRFAVVLENGSLYMWGDDSGQTNGGWGTGYAGDIWTSSAMFPQNVIIGDLHAKTRPRRELKPSLLWHIFADKKATKNRFNRLSIWACGYIFTDR